MSYVAADQRVTASSGRARYGYQSAAATAEVVSCDRVPAPHLDRVPGPDQPVRAGQADDPGPDHDDAHDRRSCRTGPAPDSIPGIGPPT